MKPGSLLKIIHRIDLVDPIYRETGWKFVIYLEHENSEIGGEYETIKVIESDGKVNHYPTESFYIEEIR
jgi:hypothetical protein